MSAAKHPSLALGIALIVFAFACVAAMSALGKAAGTIGTGLLVFFQSSISLLLFAPWTLRHGLSPLKTRRIGLHVARAGAGLLSQVLMFVAVKKMPLVSAVLLANSAPLFIPLVARIWHKTHIRGLTWLSLLIGFAGVVIILHPGLALLKSPFALFALAAALFSAFALVSVNQLSETEPPERVLFYYFLLSSLAAAPFAAWQHQTLTLHQWALLAGVGALMAASQLLIVEAYRQATPTAIAPFNYTVVIFSGLIGWAVWHNAPGWLSLLGVLLVTLGGVMSTVAGGHKAVGNSVGADFAATNAS